MANTRKETPITVAWWEQELRGAGTLYEEAAIVRRRRDVQEVRRADGVVVLDEPAGYRRDPRGMPDLNGKEIVVIQTKAMPLNAYVFGQALLSPQLISQSWSPRKIRTVLLCLADQPELSSVITRSFPEVEVRIRQGERSSFTWTRIPGAAESYVRSQGASFRGPERLASGLAIDGAIVPGLDAHDPRPLTQVVKEKSVTTLHSEMSSRNVPARIGMWMGGEIIMSQRILLAAGAESVRSVVICGHRDQAIEQALSSYADYEIITVGADKTAKAAVSAV
jgi:hypothetical protein